VSPAVEPTGGQLPIGPGDIYELTVERHRERSSATSSIHQAASMNGGPDEWRPLDQSPIHHAQPRTR
jgi:hypothetical protein